MSDKTKRIASLRDENKLLKKQVEDLKSLLNKRANMDNFQDMSKVDIIKEYRGYVQKVDNAVHKLEKWGHENPGLEIKLDWAAYLFRMEIGDSLDTMLFKEKEQTHLRPEFQDGHPQGNNTFADPARLHRRAERYRSRGDQEGSRHRG